MFTFKFETLSISDFEIVGVDLVYRLNAASVEQSYIPRTTDIITVSPASAGANIKCWVEYVTDEWHIHISDRNYDGKIYYRLKSSSST